MSNLIVEKIKNRVIQRLRENAKQDRLFRQQAIDVYESLVEYLKSGGETKGRGHGRLITVDQFTDLEKNAKNPLRIKWDQEGKVGNTDAAYAMTSKGPQITLFVMERMAYNEKEDMRREMTRKLQDNAKIFMHEYIHYLDDRRTEMDLEDLATYGDRGMKDFADYFSDPLEVNAYFQSGLAQLQSTLEVPGLLDTHMRRDWNESFRGFKEWFFDEHIPNHMLRNIDSDQRKRLINRLYGYWERIENEYNN